MKPNLKNWSAADQPREKILLLGSRQMTDSELLAIILGTGTAKCSVLDLSRYLLQRFHHQLGNLAGATAEDLRQTKGLGDAKIARVMAALEMGRRIRLRQEPERPIIQGSQTAFEVIFPHISELRVEEFWIILLNRANRVIQCQRISQGGVSGTVADPKIIFHQALAHLASGLIVVHNHPSGNLNPSQADRDLTRKLVQAGKMLDLPVLDHLIVGGENYFSFADEGILNS